jgi:hypothetical protein
MSDPLPRHLSATSQIRRHRRRLEAARLQRCSDTAWFARYPQALVRFRPQRPGDFALLEAQACEPPAFIPQGLNPSAPLSWVAVVDVMRAIGEPGNGSIRARIRTVPIRSRLLQGQMAELFAIAVCQDVLAQLQGQQPDHAELA